MAEHAAFVLPDLSGGGAERLTLDLMAGFVKRGARVDLVVMGARGAFLSSIPPGVRLFDLRAARLRQVPAALRAYLRSQQPQAVLAAMWPLTSMAVLAAAGLPNRPRLVLSEHASLLLQYARALPQLAMKLCLAATYRFADRIVAVSSGVADELAGLTRLGRERIRVIFNPIPPPLTSPPGQSKACWADIPGPRILAVGALKTEKNFALLIAAFARTVGATGGQLAIVGEGALRPELERQIAALGLQDRITLPGFCPTPGDWYANASLFVLTSHFEGFGNVLVEAMHCGVPVVATDCPYGPVEILGRGEFGTLIPPGDLPRLVSAMNEALALPEDDPEVAAARRARAAEFSVDRAVGDYWQAMFGQ